MNSDRDIKRFLEESEDLVVPENISKGIDNTLKDIKGNKHKKRKGKKAFIAASVAAILLTGSIYNSEAVGAAIKEISNKMESIFAGSLNEEGFDEYKIIVGKTVEDKGVKVTLNEFFMEDKKIYVSVDLEDKNSGIFPDYIDGEIYINGKKTNAQFRGLQLLGYIDEKNKKTTKLYWYDVSDIDLKDVKNVSVKYNMVNGVKDEYINVQDPIGEELYKKMQSNIKGNWEFSFAYDGEKVAKNIVYKKLDKTIEVNGLKIHVDTMKVTPMSVEIKYNIIDNPENKAMFFSLIDKKGNTQGMWRLGDTYDIARLSTVGLKKVTIAPYVNNVKGKPITVDLK